FLNRGIRTFPLYFTTIRTSFSAAFGGIFLPEPLQISHGRNFFTGFINYPFYYIQVMAGFSQYNRGGFFGVMPIAAHIRMRHVRMFYWLKMLHTDYFANCTFCYKLFHFNKVRRVS